VALVSCWVGTGRLVCNPESACCRLLGFLLRR
jgi:hypothetical protein